MPSDEIGKELGLENEMGVSGFREFIRALGVEFGGPKGMAKKLGGMFRDESTPASTKHQIMALVAKAYSQAAEDEGNRNFDTMSRDELVAYIRRLMDKHDGKLPEVFEKP